ncbi:MAG TPA: peptide ABC transporter substrate-binding protein [Candidatus Baltobacteraceae bacterium]|nr:peptide ABC transporter substrate-binding protein [Candidatus Baltobacteraceae bacterium]
MRRAPVLLLAAVTLLAGCTKSAPATHGRHSWSRAGVLRVAIGEEPKNLNPLLAGTVPEVFVDRLMFEPLVSADAHANPIPILVQTVPTQANGGISRDGLTVTYRLRRDVRWSDGVALTARDVRWSWQAIENPNNDVVSRHGYDDVASIETPDAYIAVVHLKRPFAPFVNTFFAESDQPFEILPAHVLEKYPDINHIPFDAQPTVSDGPFLFTAWERGDRVIVDANPHFFLGKPWLRRIEVSFVPNEDTEVSLLRTHAIDYVHQPSIKMFPALRTLPDVKIVWVNVNGFEGMEMNLSHPLLADRRVRTAIAAAIDKAALARHLAYGQVLTATEDLPHWIWAFDPSVRSVAFDPATSRALLRSAGWIAGPDGIARKNGQPLRLMLTTDSATAAHRSETLLVQEALHQVGIEADVRYYPLDVLYAPAGLGGILHGGRFDLLIFGWYAGIDPDNSSLFTCANFAPRGYNDTHYCSPQMEAAQATALAHYDRATRKRAYAQIEHLLSVDNPAYFFWWQRQQEPISVDFHGFDPNPVIESWDAWRWSI